MRLRLLPVLLLAAAALAAVSPTAHADAGNPLSSVTAEMLDSTGNPENRAGASPDRMKMAMQMDVAAANLKDFAFELPPGILGNANAVPTCPRHLASILDPNACPSATQVGEVKATVLSFTTVLGLYNIDPDPEDLAEFAFKNILFDGRFHVKMLPSGQVRFEMPNVIQDSPLPNLVVEVWGIPADHQAAPTAPRRKFLTMPGHCDGTAPTMKVEARSWRAPATPHFMSGAIAPPLVGCENLELHPQLGFSLDNATTDSPTGVRVAVDVPQSSDPDIESPARAKDIRIRFPRDLAMSPGAAQTLVACSEKAVRLGQPGPAACPASSKVGTAELSSPFLRSAIPGTLYIGRQLSDTDYRMYVAMNTRAIDIEIPGTLHVDPSTGQMTADILGFPETDFERLTLNFSGGSQALFVTPLECGSRTASIALTPYSGGSPVASTASVATSGDPFGRPCPSRPPFSPRFVAGASRTRAGGPAPLSMTIRRASGEQLIDRFTMTLPAGMSARLASVPLCRAAAAVTGACPRASRIGSAVTEAGSGTSVLALEGDAFLTAPYRGAPFGVALVFRAVAGPFDLGTVVVRAALRVDPLTGQVIVETDRLPRQVKGIPLRIQTLGLDVDRPGFMVNPTSCAPSAVKARIESAEGGVSNVKSRFAVGGCRGLRFRPKVAMTLADRSELHVDGHPRLRIGLRSSTRGANLRGLSFEVPPFIGPSPVGPSAICSRAQLMNGRCPAASTVGSVFARSPLLSEPLRGTMYSVQPPGSGIADVWGVMRGMGITVRFRMKNAFVDGRLAGQLVDLPDIPLSVLAVTFAGGKHGMLSLGREPCVAGRARRASAKVRLTAYNSATHRATVPVGVARSSCR